MNADQFLADRFGALPELGLLNVFAASGAIGLLIGLERERHPEAAAGLRTFTLTALFGTACALLGDLVGLAWLPAIGLLLVGAMSVTAQHREAERSSDPGTTTTIAILLCFVLGTMVWHGLAAVAASLAVLVTALLYFKTELRGLSARLTRRDMLSILQFGVLSLVVLPALPDRGYGPHDALNPHQIWLMVVLISGVSLAGYVALRLAGARHGMLLTGILGGLVSSTATTLIHARRARELPAQTDGCAMVVLLAGGVVFLRIGLFGAIVAPSLMSMLAPVLLAGLVPMLVAALLRLRGLPETEPVAPPEVRNPAELRAALSFGALYALVLLLAAELTGRIGSAGLFAVALASGLTDVDAVTLSSLRLHGLGSVKPVEAVVAIALAIAANMAVKFALVRWAGSRELARRSAGGFFAAAAALAASTGLLWVVGAPAAPPL